MKITYIFRPKSKERSIERVFSPVINQLINQGYDIQLDIVFKLKFWPVSVIFNIIKYAIKSRRKGIFHITGDIQYVGCFMNPANTILTIHDCVMLQNSNTPNWQKKLIYKLWYEIPLRRLKYITCISDTTKKNLISFFPWVSQKVTVIPNSLGYEFCYSRKEFNEKLPRILHIGTRSNKNLERVIEALSGITCKLVIIGILSDRQKVLLRQNKIVFENKYNISDNDILYEYKKADIISFPSLFEGFGMPIIEGQTIGRPIITSEREPMRSVAGDGAILVDPESIGSIRNGFNSIITDESLRNKIVQAGSKNAKRYDINEITKQYLKIYRNALNR